MMFLISHEDNDLLSVDWKINTTGYVVSTIEARTVEGCPVRAWCTLHRLVAYRMFGDAIIGHQIDHINGNRIDNRRSNLRVATASQNMRNRRDAKKGAAGYFGVALSGTTYRAYYMENDQQVHVGSYATAHEAAYARDLAVKEKFGEFAYLNGVTPVPLDPLNRRNGKDGPVGVRKHRNKWAARAKIKGVEHHIGLFETERGAMRSRGRFLANQA